MRNLHEQRKSAVDEARKILDTAERERRNLTAGEQASYDAIDRHIDYLGNEIEKQEQASKAQQLRKVTALASDKDGNKQPLSVDYPGYKLGNLTGRDARRNTFAPGSNEAIRSSDAYRKSFLGYLGGNDRHALSLQVSKDNKGGYLAPAQFVAELIKFVDNAVFMRQISTVLPPMPSAVSLGVPSWDSDPGDADWTAEVPASSISADTSSTVGKREFIPHLTTKLVKMSTKLLRASAIDIESLLVQRLGYVFGITEEQAYMTGNGNDRPLGIFVASDNGISTARDTTASATTSFTADDVIDCFYNLKQQYQINASWVVSRTWLKMCRKLKDGTGQYLWQPGLAGGQPGTILERPYYMSEYASATFTTGLYVAVVGDFKAGYMIADALDMEVQRLNELFALTNQVGLVARKETDGAPVLAEAFSRMKLA